MAANPLQPCQTPWPMRFWHWLHGLGFIFLVLTGIQIRFPEYFQLLPNFRITIEVHNETGLLMTVWYFLWFFYYTVFTGNLGATYLPKKGEVRFGLRDQLREYFGAFLRGPAPARHGVGEPRFTPLEKMLYLLLMLGLFPLQMITGMALKSLYPKWGIIDMFGSVKFLSGLHFLNGCLLLALVLTHIYLTTLNGNAWPRFRAWRRALTSAQDPS